MLFLMFVSNFTYFLGLIHLMALCIPGASNSDCNSWGIYFLMFGQAWLMWCGAIFALYVISEAYVIVSDSVCTWNLPHVKKRVPSGWEKNEQKKTRTQKKKRNEKKKGKYKKKRAETLCVFGLLYNIHYIIIRLKFNNFHINCNSSYNVQVDYGG